VADVGEDFKKNVRLEDKELFLIRLADRQGVLRGPKLSQFQRWCLGYLIAEERSERFNEVFELEKFFWAIIDRPGYEAAFVRTDDDLGAGESHISPEDFADIDQWLRTLDRPRTISADSFNSFN
jgi:hypothetical protein